MKGLLWMACFCGLLLTACSKDEEETDIIWDFWNYNMVFAVTDRASGCDLLDPEAEENILGSDIRVIYQGREYGCVDETRALEKGPFALRHGYDENSGRYVLAFGRFSPADQYHKETFVVDWGDGSQNKISFDCYVTWPEGHPVVQKKLLVDDVLIKDTPYLISVVK